MFFIFYAQFYILFCVFVLFQESSGKNIPINFTDENFSLHFIFMGIKFFFMHIYQLLQVNIPRMSYQYLSLSTTDIMWMQQFFGCTHRCNFNELMMPWEEFLNDKFQIQDYLTIFLVLSKKRREVCTIRLNDIHVNK